MMTATNIQLWIKELEHRIELARSYSTVPVSDPDALVERIVSQYIDTPPDWVE